MSAQLAAVIGDGRDSHEADRDAQVAIKYRPEIDGLRAVAVVPVVLFHAGLPWLKGGFLGVDIFYVISGYLISSIILGDISASRFSVLAFYERRFRRILPAYVVMVLATALFAWFWMMPSELKDFSRSVLASSFFSSNILFWLQAGYFQEGSLEKPLLHTWSLSVEEQFYVFFPLLLLALSHLRRRWAGLVIALLTILSLALTEYGRRHIPTGNFYLLPFRAWELGVGALCALYLRSRGPQTNSILAAVGFLAVMASLAFYGESIPMPSVYGLAPVLGTALIVLFASPGTWVGRLLAQRTFVFIGLISYSTYLWHQPMLALARIRSLPSAPEWLLLLLACASFGLGYLSWRYIEKPFRRGSGLSRVWSRRRVLSVSVAALAALAGIGLVGNFADGFPRRLPPRAVKLAGFMYDTSPLENDHNCAFYQNAGMLKHPLPACTAFLSNGRADVVFIGDSHSGTISYDTQIALKKEGISSYAVTYDGCLGLRGFKNIGMPVDYDCNGYNQGMIEYARKIHAKVIVVTSRFPLYLYETRFDNGEGGTEIGHVVRYDRVDYNGPSGPDDPARKQRMLEGITEELRKLTEEFSVVLVDPIPEAGWSVPRLAAKIAFFRKQDTFTVTTDYAAYERRSAEVIRAFDQVHSQRLYRVHPADVFCNRLAPGRCVNATQDQVYYFDNNHLSRTGARLLVPSVVDQVRQALEHR